MPIPRDWPNVARWARDGAAEDAQEIIQLLTPLVYGEQVTEIDRLRREARALSKAQEIARLLESVGACTRP